MAMRTDLTTMEQSLLSSRRGQYAEPPQSPAAGDAIEQAACGLQTVLCSLTATELSGFAQRVKADVRFATFVTSLLPKKADGQSVSVLNIAIAIAMLAAGLLLIEVAMPALGSF